MKAVSSAFLVLLGSMSVALGQDLPPVDPQLKALATNPVLSGNDPHWLLDPNSKCWVFDGYPLAGETATWSGACKDSLALGEGTVTWYVDGKIAETRTGTFVLGSLNGHGVATMSDRSTYDGNWIYGARYGSAVLQLANGDTFRGMWPGKGTYTRADGTVCDAESRRVQGTVNVVAPCARGDWSSR